MWEFFPSGGPPPPPPCLGMTRLFEEKNHVFFCILGGVSHVKNSKKWKWDSGRPPPCFFKIPTFSRFFWGGASLNSDFLVAGCSQKQSHLKDPLTVMTSHVWFWSCWARLPVKINVGGIVWQLIGNCYGQLRRVVITAGEELWKT